jgi:L-fucose mutarotase
MLKGLSPYLSPDLLKILAEMGHGDEIILADAHFPGHTFCQRVLRADGVRVASLLDAIIPVFELDPQVEADYTEAIRRHAPSAPAPERIDRFAFYDRATKAYAAVITGEVRKYGNILLKKGVTP